MGQVSGMQLWIHDHTKSRGTVSMSTDWVDVLSILDFLVLDGRFLWFAGWNHSKMGRHVHVEYWYWGWVWFPILISCIQFLHVCDLLLVSSDMFFFVSCTEKWNFSCVFICCCFSLNLILQKIFNSLAWFFPNEWHLGPLVQQYLSALSFRFN